MKAFALFLFRLASGLYLVAWALVKLVSPERAMDISDKFYFGYFSTPEAQYWLAGLAAVLGIFVALGLLRLLAYPAQVLALGIAAAAVGKAVIVTPVDLANGIEAATLLLPTLCVFLVSLAPLVWWKNDFLTLDRFVDWRLADLTREAGYASMLAAPAAAAATEVFEEAPVEAEPEPEMAAAEEEATVEEVAAEAVEAVVEEAAVEEAAVEAGAEEAHGEEAVVEAEAATEEPPLAEVEAHAAPEPAIEEDHAGAEEEELAEGEIVQAAHAPRAHPELVASH